MILESSKRIETNTHELVIKVNKEIFQEEVTKVFRKANKNIQIPGFRKGKAPRPMVNNIYGEDFFWEEAVNNIYPEMYKKAADEANIEPVDSAEIDINDLSADGFSFVATVTVKPEVKLGKYKKLKANRVVREAGEKEVQSELDSFLERGARMIPVENREAKENDTANINFDGFKDEVPFEGGKGENFDLVLGSGQFIPGFEEQVIGHKTGDEFDVKLSFPDEYHVEELKGQPVVFKVKINSLTEKELPELDDEFAKDVSEFDTLDELKEDIRKNIQQRYDDESDRVLEDVLMDMVSDDIEAEIPEIMFEHRIDDMVKEFEQNLSSQNMNLDMYLQYTNMDIAQLRESFKDQADRQVKVQLALEAISKEEDFNLSDEDYESHYAKIAEGYGMEKEMIENIIPKDQISKEIKLNKSIDFVKKSAEVKDITAKEEKKEAEKVKKAAKKATEKKPAAKKATEKKPAAKKAAVKKPVAKKAAVKKPAAKKATKTTKKDDKK